MSDGRDALAKKPVGHGEMALAVLSVRLPCLQRPRDSRAGFGPVHPHGERGEAIQTEPMAQPFNLDGFAHDLPPLEQLLAAWDRRYLLDMKIEPSEYWIIEMDAATFIVVRRIHSPTSISNTMEQL
jgi:hypothetical protein